MLVALVPVLVAVANGIFFGGGGGGGGGGNCCCGCGTPQPPSCGCVQCPAQAPCPACPQNYCPPPPTAYCPQVQPVFLPGGCPGEAGCSAGYPVAAPYIPRGEAGYAAPRPPFLGNFPSGEGYTGGGTAEPSYNPGNINAPTGAEVGLQQQAVVPSYLPQGNELNADSSSSSNYAPPLNKLRSPENMCEQAKVKYVVLKMKKVPGSSTEEMMEEAEEVKQTPPVEATASPLEPQQTFDDINRNEVTQDDTEQDARTQARGASTLSDAKCNSKPLKDLITENVVRDDALASKRSIHEASLKRFSDSTVDVICSGTGFTYLVSTTEHCEAQKDNVICFVYKRPLLR